jgi:hypothetical protein
MAFRQTKEAAWKGGCGTVEMDYLRAKLLDKASQIRARRHHSVQQEVPRERHRRRIESHCVDRKVGGVWGARDVHLKSLAFQVR